MFSFKNITDMIFNGFVRFTLILNVFARISVDSSVLCYLHTRVTKHLNIQVSEMRRNKLLTDLM